MPRLRLPGGLAFIGVLAVSVVLAQSARRPLGHGDFDPWRSIATPQLSNDGRWLAYSFMPQEADGDLVLREIATAREIRVPVGALPPPAPAPNDENTPSEAPPPPRNIRIAFTSDSQFAVATTHPAKADVAAARKAKKKPDEMPKGGLIVVKLATGEITRVERVKNFQVPSKGGAWLAYAKEAKPGEKKPDEPPGEKKAEGETEPDAESDENEAALEALDAEDAAAPRAPAAAGGEGGATRTYGTELVLRDLTAGSDRTFDAVADYSLARDGRTLVFSVSSRTQTDNGLFVVAPGDPAKPVALLSGRGRYSRIAWDREQTQLAFVSDRDSAGARSPRFKLYHWFRGSGEAVALVAAETKGLPDTLVVSNNAAASFSRDGRKLYVPAGAPPKPPRPAGTTAPTDEDKVVADLWHWRDGFVQPMQKTRATQERNRTYRGVFDLAAKTYVQLADRTMATVALSDDGARAIGYDDRAYRHLGDYEGRYTDVYLVDVTTAERKRVLTRLRGESGSTLQWSPDGKWGGYFQDKQWWVLDTATGAARSLTAKSKVAFHNELNDRPEPSGSYGGAGWTKDSSSFLVYDRFDVWQLFVDGRAPRNLTAGQGRTARVQYRVQRIEPVDEDDDERGLDPAKPLVLRGESEDTRASGYFRINLGAGETRAPEKLLWGDRNYRYAGRARDADALMIVASRFDEFPDVHVTSSAFGELKKVTDGGAQLAPFTWGTSELVAFRGAGGTPLQAVLFKPADFDAKKKYPLIIYLYERLSQTLHNFVPPAPGTNINVSYYVSNGYCVLMPDIVYQTGHPGQSALRCVLPALDAVVARGFIDEKAVGIQGHSWGGYQIAYMLTQTNRFRAAEAGAPVGNMTSAYSGIRWGSGMPRQFQYETGQSRIGQPLHESAKLYLENSPIFHAHAIRTPLLIMSNDNDDAVPWYQGIELFLALRRQGKPAWLFNYNGEFHGLRRRPNQKDWAKRMSQFFDHFLKGAPAPAWLEEGIPYIEREEEKERFNAPAPVAAGVPAAAATASP